MYVRTYLVYADDWDLENARKMLGICQENANNVCYTPKCLRLGSTRTRLDLHVNKR